jgi:putative MATE family efflux protein
VHGAWLQGYVQVRVMKRYWLLFLEAVRGSERDYTAGPVGPALVMLSVPMVLEMAMESLFAVVDVFFVSRVSADAVATVGVTETMLTIVYTVALGLGIGAMAVVSRRIGEKDDEGAAQAAAQAIALGVIVAVAVGAFGFFNAERLMRLMGATESMIASSLGYTQVMFAGNVTVTLLFLINAIFRGAGDPAIAMRMLWLGNAINIVLDPILIFGLGPIPAMDVTGAAIATNIGRGVAVTTQLWMLGSGRSRIRLHRRHIELVPTVMWNVCRLSGSGFLQILIDTSSYIGLVRVISTFGSDALAGYTIGIRTVIFAILPAWGLANAAATMVGQAFGAKDPDRAERSVWTAGKYNALVLGLVSVFFVVLAPQIVAIYTSDPRVAPYATSCLRIVSAGFVFFAYGLVFTQSFNGAGDTWTPTWINLGCFWLFQIPLAWLLAIQLEMGPQGVFIAMTVAFSLLAVVSGVIFRRGAWKTTQV